MSSRVDLKASENAKQLLSYEKELTAALAQLEQDIHEAESAYFDETALSGNVVHGWEGYLDRY